MSVFSVAFLLRFLQYDAPGVFGLRIIFIFSFNHIYLESFDGVSGEFG